MTVQNTLTTATFTSSGAVETLTLPFNFYSESFIQVEHRDSDGDPFDPVRLLTRGTHFNVKGAGEPATQGTVIMLAAAYAGGEAVGAGDKLFIYRQTARLQPTDFRSQGRFLPEVHEATHDRAVHMIQEIEDGESPVTAGTFDEDAPKPVGATGAVGSSNLLSHSDHVHAHGNQAGGGQHALATTSAHGFMSSVQKGHMDTLTGGVASNADALHAHAFAEVALSDDDPESLDSVAMPGVADEAARIDHVHTHGSLGGGIEHAEASTESAGFLHAIGRKILNILSLQEVTNPDDTLLVGTPLTDERNLYVTGNAQVVGGLTGGFLYLPPAVFHEQITGDIPLNASIVLCYPHVDDTILTLPAISDWPFKMLWIKNTFYDAADDRDVLVYAAGADLFNGPDVAGAFIVLTKQRGVLLYAADEYWWNMTNNYIA